MVEVATQIAMTAFACMGFGWLMFLIGKHGWAWVAAKLKARAADAEAKVKQQLSGTVGDLVHTELAKFESDIAAIKAKVGL